MNLEYKWESEDLTGKLINRWLKSTVIPGLELRNDPEEKDTRKFQEARKLFAKQLKEEMKFWLNENEIWNWRIKDGD